MDQDIEQVIDIFRRRSSHYAKNERYYRGDHDLAFATEKFANAFGSLFREFALNLCPAICDAVRDKLRITGFSVADTGGDAIVKEGVFGVGRTLPDGRVSVRTGGPHSDSERIWDANRMHLRSGQLHKEALINGDAYIIVWPDASGRAAMYPNRAASCVVFYDEEVPGKIVRAAKYWLTHDNRTRLNIFYPDRIERYISQKQSETPANSKDLVPVSGDRHRTSDLEAGITPNPFGVVPVFHFANNGDIGSLGVSELAAAMPIQDGLNKSVLDMLVAMEYSAYRQRWVAGIEVETDSSTGELIAPFKAGVDHLWISENPDARFGDFESANLEQFLKVKDGFRIDMASVTGTPLHYLQPQTKSVPSGESLRRAETRFLSKVRDRQAAFGQVWADAMEFALSIEGISGARLITQWEDPASQSEREVLENILLKKQIGLSVEQALIEAGYGAADVKAMVIARDE